MKELKFSNPITGSDVTVYESADSKYVLFEGYAICKLLGYANPARTVEQLVSSKYIRRVRGILGRNKLPKVLLAEPGVYQLAIKSRAKRAEEFQAWVFEEVLPSIHHNGGYILGQETLAEDERNKLISEIKQLRENNNLLNDKVCNLEHKNKQLYDDNKIINNAFNKLSDQICNIASNLTMSNIENNLF